MEGKNEYIDTKIKAEYLYREIGITTFNKLLIPLIFIFQFIYSSIQFFCLVCDIVLVSFDHPRAFRICLL